MLGYNVIIIGRVGINSPEVLKFTKYSSWLGKLNFIFQYAMFAVGGLLILLSIVNSCRSEPGEVNPSAEKSIEKELESKNVSENPYENLSGRQSGKVSVSL